MKGKTMTNATHTRTAAEMTKCDYPKCDGFGHEDCLPEPKWTHNLTAASFDDGIITGQINVVGGTAEGYVDLAGWYGEASSAELRTAADKYEAFPEWMRSLADQIDAFNAASTTVQS
jgi:hypothetical protein